MGGVVVFFVGIPALHIICHPTQRRKSLDDNSASTYKDLVQKNDPTMPARTIDGVQHLLDLKFGAHSLPRLKIALFSSGLDLCQVRMHRTRLLKSLLHEEWLVRRVLQFEQDLLEHSGQAAEGVDPTRLLNELFQSEEHRTDWKRIVQYLYLYPTFQQIPDACLELLRCCLTNTGHKRAVVVAGGVAAIVSYLGRLTSLHNCNTSAAQTPSQEQKERMARQHASSAKCAVSLLLRLMFAQGDSGYYDREGAAVGASKDGQTLHLPVVELLSQAGAWNAIAQATGSNIFLCEYSGEEGYERQLARHNIETTCRGLQLSPSSSSPLRLSNDLLQKRVRFLCTCLASLLDDPSIGEPLGSILKQH